jgi:exopolyphosphatase / guanosine-5'-triphosphate,3'-diphosphate pyrophosphatase
MLLGAIDVGSNAVRILIATAHFYDGKWNIRREEYLRYPLRLGEDVFSTGVISNVKVEKFVKLMTSFRLLMEIYEVSDFMACATSAMRDAVNGSLVVKRIKAESGIEIKIIDGDYEAELMDNVLLNSLDDKNYIHIDVGGGSTEINFISANKKIASRSFNLGGVRALKGKNTDAEWEKLKDWVKESVEEHKTHHLNGLGTGGNIRKLHELLSNNTSDPVSLTDLKHLKEELEEMSLEERMGKFKINADRADVIVPAADIYCKILNWANCDNINAPSIGLVDGIIHELFEKLKKNAAYNFLH